MTTTPTRSCNVCQLPLVLAHCTSRTCTWCRGCYERELQEGKKP